MVISAQNQCIHQRTSVCFPNFIPLYMADHPSLFALVHLTSKSMAFGILSFHSASQTTHSWEKYQSASAFALYQRHIEMLPSQYKISYLLDDMCFKSFPGTYFKHICFLASPAVLCGGLSKALCISFPSLAERAFWQDYWCYSWEHILSWWKWGLRFGEEVLLSPSSVAQIRNCFGCQQFLFYISCPWSDSFIRFHRETDLSCGKKKYIILAANAESSLFAAYWQWNFTSFHSDMDQRFLLSVSTVSKSRFICWNKK